MIDKLKDWLSVRNVEVEEFTVRYPFKNQNHEEWEKDDTIHGFLREYDEEPLVDEEALREFYDDTGMMPVFDERGLEWNGREMEYYTLVLGEAIKVRGYWRKCLIVPEWGDSE